MKISNPFQMNDWEIKKFLSVILSFQLAFWGLLWLDLIGLHIPILRQFVGIIYLTFVPGILFLRILKLHSLGNLKVILYTIGMSLSILIFVGFFINTIFLLFGISRPISLWPLVYTISFIVVVFSIFAYIRDRSFSSPSYLSLEKVLSPQIMFLSIIPFGGILGTYLMNFYSSNLLLMILLLVISLVPVVVVFTRFISEKHYPYAVFTIAIALLYYSALNSMYIWGWDIQAEYYVINNVIQNTMWDSAIYGNLNAMLSLVTLGPIYSIILNLGLDWVFKIIYPLLFAFVPLGLYAIFRLQTDKKIAFLGCFFFISIFSFYNEMVSLARQEIAELFLVLLILSIIDRNLNKFSKSAFFLIFSTSIIVSHYGLSYLFLFILIIAWSIYAIGYQLSSRKYIVRFLIWFHGKFGYQVENYLQKYSFRLNPIPFIFVLWYSVFLLVWYIYTAGSSSFDSIVRIGYHISTSVFSEFLNPESVQGLAIITSKTSSPIHDVTKYLNMLTIFFIVIGFVFSVTRIKKIQFDLRYLILSFGALCICVCGVILPYFSSSLNTSRVYQISLIFLAPFCIIGGIAVIREISGILKITWTNQGVKNSLKVLSIFFTIFLLFNSGWVDTVAKDNSGAFLNNSVDYPIFNEPEIVGAKWLAEVKNDELIYADENRYWLLTRFNPTKTIGRFSIETNEIPEKSYIYLGKLNIKQKKALVFTEKGIIITQYIDYSRILANRSKIYEAGSAEVYHQ